MSIYDEDVMYKMGMQNGSANLLQAIVEARKGWPINPMFKRFIWRANDGKAANPLSRTTIQQGKTVKRLAEMDAEINALKVSRDPCRRCGVRGDAGCSCDE